MELSRTLQENSGLNWVLHQLETLSPFGRAAARTLPWYGPGKEDELNRELDRVERAARLWQKRPPALDTAVRHLGAFRDVRGCLDRAEDNPFDLVELFELKYFLMTFCQFKHAYEMLGGFEGVSFAPADEALEILDPSGRQLYSFSIENGAHPELASLRKEKRQVEEEIRRADEAELPVLMERRRLLAVREHDAELEVRKELTARIMALRQVFLTNMEALGRVDLILAKGKLAGKYCCVRPEILGNPCIALQGVIHPRVACRLEDVGEKFTPVDVELRKGCTVITGANMGGKTVSLQAVSLSVLLAQCGFFVFAKAAQLPLFDEVALILADSGSGAGGLSSFGAEVVALNGALERSGGRFFFLGLDEFARGTNPQEGSALAKSLAAHLNESNGISLMTTHYDGVSEAAGAHYQVAGLVREVEGDEGDDPRVRIARRMDYRLLPTSPGEPCPKDALRVCRLLDLDEKLLKLLEGNS